MASERLVSVPSPQTTLIILLGAHEWPFYTKFDSSEAFTQAAEKMRTYFTTVFGVPEVQLLWLFDSELDAIEMGKAISRHLQTFQGSVRDVIVYYVGHAKLTHEYNQLYLAIRGTQEDNPERTSLTVESLASILGTQARALRRFYIFDCCYAARALEDLQGASEIDLWDNTFKEGEDNTQGQGYAALCSSGKYTLSVWLPDETNTFFSAALLRVLSETNQNAPKMLSFYNVYEAINPQLRVLYEQYRLLYSESEVKDPPEAVIHGEDLTRIPLLPLGDANQLSTDGEIKPFPARKTVEEQALPVRIQLVSEESQIANLSEIEKHTPQQEEQLLHASSGGLFSGAKPSSAPWLRSRWLLISVLIALVLVVVSSSLYAWVYLPKYGNIFGTQAGVTATKSVIPANFIAFSTNSFSLDYPRGWTRMQNKNKVSFLDKDNVTKFIVSANNNGQSSNAMVNDLTGDILSCTEQSAQPFASVVVNNVIWQQSVWNCFLDGIIYVCHILIQTSKQTVILYAGWQLASEGSKIIHYFDQVNAQYFQPMLQSFRFK